MNDRKRNIAIFFDSDNISPRLISSLLYEIKPMGNIILKKAFADWSNPNRAKWMNNALANGVELVQSRHLNGFKNASDIKIIIDIVETMFTINHISTFIIVSNDTDFSSLHPVIKKQNKELFFVGYKDASPELRSSCDQFIPLEPIILKYNISGLTKQSKKAKSTKDKKTDDSIQISTKSKDDVSSDLSNITENREIIKMENKKKSRKRRSRVLIDDDSFEINEPTPKDILKSDKDLTTEQLDIMKRRIRASFEVSKKMNGSMVKDIIEKVLNTKLKNTKLPFKNKFQNFLNHYFSDLLITDSNGDCYSTEF